MAKDPWRKGLRSEALAVHPDQIAEAREHDKEHGCSVPYDKWGRPVFHSRKKRRDYLKAHGFHDKDGGYSD